MVIEPQTTTQWASRWVINRMGCADAVAQSHFPPFLIDLKTLVASMRRNNQSSPPFVPVTRNAQQSDHRPPATKQGLLGVQTTPVALLGSNADARNAPATAPE